MLARCIPNLIHNWTWSNPKKLSFDLNFHPLCGSRAWTWLARASRTWSKSMSWQQHPSQCLQQSPPGNSLQHQLFQTRPWLNRLQAYDMISNMSLYYKCIYRMITYHIQYIRYELKVSSAKQHRQRIPDAYLCAAACQIDLEDVNRSIKNGQKKSPIYIYIIIIYRKQSQISMTALMHLKSKCLSLLTL